MRALTTSANVMPPAFSTVDAFSSTVLVWAFMSPLIGVLSLPFRLMSPARKSVLPDLMP